MMAFLNILHAHAVRPTDLNITPGCLEIFQELAPAQTALMELLNELADCR
jgi:hypothetical protein